MKKTGALFLAVLLACSALGCMKQNEQPQQSALELMRQVNRSNILNSDNSSRIWYQLDPKYFADSTQSGTGDLTGLLQHLGYLSDNDANTMQDLNMTGLLLMNVILEDESQAPADLQAIDPQLGDTQALADLCSQAGELNMPVMMRMNVRTISRNSSYFTRLKDYVRSLPPETSIEDFDPELKNIFRIAKDQSGENWIAIEGSPFSYQALPGTDTPLSNPEGDVWRSLIAQSVDTFLALGISGFYLEDVDSLYPGEPARDRDFVNWFESMVHERSAGAVIAVSATDWSDPMNEINAILLDRQTPGVQGMLVKAVTGAIPASELGTYIDHLSSRAKIGNAWSLDDGQASMDVLKSQGKQAQYKMALALELMLSGQVFITAGDELGLSSSQSDLIAQVIDMPEEGEEQEQETDLQLEFGSLRQQEDDGNSIFSFLQQALLLRNSYGSISSGRTTTDFERTNDSVLVLDKSTSTSHCVVVFNFSDQEAEVDVSSMTISQTAPELGGILLTNAASTVTLEEGRLKMPPCSAAVLK